MRWVVHLFIELCISLVELPKGSPPVLTRNLPSHWGPSHLLMEATGALRAVAAPGRCHSPSLLKEASPKGLL